MHSELQYESLILKSNKDLIFLNNFVIQFLSTIFPFWGGISGSSQVLALPLCLEMTPGDKMAYKNIKNK